MCVTVLTRQRTEMYSAILAGSPTNSSLIALAPGISHFFTSEINIVKTVAINLLTSIDSS
ncbi:hypothetical protein E2C01_069607 [Portunus trituberculatus]|uniref:Uncharacterized protein n=1 Tax=Portunus trituberculatus TaxID=210409 RepID=A0A5B7HZ06_PORTR|nr:hypothetical protein [Portunus trituberculatus]